MGERDPFHLTPTPSNRDAFIEMVHEKRAAKGLPNLREPRP